MFNNECKVFFPLTLMIFVLFLFSGFALSDNGLQAVNEVCFAKCHKKTDFTPGSKSEAQWQALIGNDEHAIFAHIPWKSDAQKQKVLNYLKAHSSDKNRAAQGIGIWK